MAYARWGLLSAYVMGIICFLGSPLLAQSVCKPSDLAIREIGIPVHAVNRVFLYPATDGQGKPVIVAAMGQKELFFVLQIDPDTGRFEQFDGWGEKNDRPLGCMSRSGKLYIGTAYGGKLFCYDPAIKKLSDLGEINPGKSRFPCRMDEDSQGRIWIGSYPGADLTCYDPANKEFIRYGSVADDEMYAYTYVDCDDTIATLVMTVRPRVIVFDPKTGKKTTVGPITIKGEDSIGLHKADDGKLYITSSKGNFRIDGTKAVPVDTVPNRATDNVLSDGRSFYLTDMEEHICRTLAVQHTDGTIKTFYLDYKGTGSGIFSLHTGPDGCLYGSSILPLHLFRYNPADGSLVDLGRCSTTSGEAYSMANYEGKIYIGCYGGTRLSVYDPKQPWHFGEEAGDNPRDYGRVDNVSCRPRDMLAGPLGRVWIASAPDYGMWGGPLSWFDPKTETKHAYYRIVGDGSCYTLAHLEEQKLIAIGTNIKAGNGTRPKVKQAEMVLWDYENETIVWRGKPDRNVTNINALLAGKDGKLYGTICDENPEVFVFDPEVREFTESIALPLNDDPCMPLDVALQYGPDGLIYGFARSALYTIDPNTKTLKVLIRKQGEFFIPGPIIGKDIYYGHKQYLRAIKIFD